jgi:hypothetical protein
MSLIASRCLVANRHDRAPSNDTCNRQAVPDQIVGQIGGNSSKVPDVAQAVPPLDQWRGYLGEHVKWMDRQWYIVERGVAFGIAEDLERDLPAEIGGTRNPGSAIAVAAIGAYDAPAAINGRPRADYTPS